jgi:WhiB family transcriptional regulator, redox-sensing transcriptional regulator
MASSWVGIDGWMAERDEDPDDYRGADGLAALVGLVRRIEEERPDWQKDALCLEYPEVDFFPLTSQGGAVAKEVCSRCLVADACLDYALNNEIEHGVWGATQGSALRRMRKQK